MAGNSQSKRYGGDGGPGAPTPSSTRPRAVGVDTAGNVYISDSGNNLVRKVDARRHHHHHRRRHGRGPDRRPTTNQTRPGQRLRRRRWAGHAPPTSTAPAASPSTPPATSTSARSRGPGTDTTGPHPPDRPVRHHHHHRRRRPGHPTAAAPGWPATPARRRPEAQFNTMHDLTIDNDGNLWIADSKNNLVRMVFDPAHAAAVAPGGHAAGRQPPAGTPAGGGATAVPGEPATGCSAPTARSTPSATPRRLGDAAAGARRPRRRPRADAVGPTATGSSTTTGGVYAFGDAAALGQRRRRPPGQGEKVTSLSATPTGQGLLDLHQPGPGLRLRRRHLLRRHARR